MSCLKCLVNECFIRKDSKHAKKTCDFKNNGGGYDNIYAQQCTHSQQKHIAVILLNRLIWNNALFK